MLPILPLRLHFTADTTGDLGDFPGALWRSVMGLHLKRRHCLGGDDDRNRCALGDRCVYHAIMSPTPPSGTSLIGGKHNAPPPYILSPRSAGMVAAGDPVVLDLTLIGNAAKHALHVIRALQTGAEQGMGAERLRLHFSSLHHCINGLDGLDGLDGISIDPAHPPAPCLPPNAPAAPTRVRVHLEQPLRLREENRYLRPEHFSARAFFKSLLLRIRNLADTHAAEARLNFDAPQLLTLAEALSTAQAVRWHRQQRWSARQKTTVDTSGLIGHFDLFSNTAQPLPAELWKLLWGGQWLHLGKSTVMGLGCYRLEPLADTSNSSEKFLAEA